jgi:hypothetical protein
MIKAGPVRGLQRSISQFKKLFLPISIQRPVLFWFALALLVVGVLVTLHFDMQQLKDWQTLLAAMIALGAAIIAYRGAMAKVMSDRDLAVEELLRRKRGLYLRLHFALHRMLVEAEKVKKKTTWFNNQARLARNPITINDITVPKEIEEAWNHLDLFSIPISSQLHRIRVSLEFWQYTIFVPDHPSLSKAPDEKARKSLELFISTVSSACNKIKELIQDEIGDVWS